MPILRRLRRRNRAAATNPAVIRHDHRPAGPIRTRPEPLPRMRWYS